MQLWRLGCPQVVGGAPSCDLQSHLKLLQHTAGTCNALTLPRAHPSISYAEKRLSVAPVSSLSDIKAEVRALRPMKPHQSQPLITVIQREVPLLPFAVHGKCSPVV